MIRKIYGPEFGVARSKTFLSEFNHLPDVVTDIPGLNIIEYLPVFLKIIFRISIRYKGRKHFWHLVIWTIKNRLRLVDWALVNSIFIFQLHNLQQDYSKSISQMK
ncbi:MAG: DUF4070 domain-containing protein [Candidatus Marinimicrobia bacterium]|nr:DUF4070 domain-containing protein [Candidatus Neomarinimicrobiota bacterium]